MAEDREIVLWGAAGQAKVVRDCLGDDGAVVAVFDNDPQRTSCFKDVPIFHGPSGLQEFLASRGGPNGVEFVVAIGGDLGRARCEIHDWLLNAGLRSVSAVHRTAFVAPDVVMGSGSVVCAKAAVCVDVRMGPCCIVNTSASVDHESVLGRGVHIAPGAHLAGCVTVGDYAMVGTGAVVLPRLTIGEGAMVGAGAVVTRDVPQGAVVCGVPARAA